MPAGASVGECSSYGNLGIDLMGRKIFKKKNRKFKTFFSNLISQAEAAHLSVQPCTDMSISG